MRALRRIGSATAALTIAMAPAALMGYGAAVAAALPPGVDPSLIPFTPILRRCDYSVLQYVSASGDGRATAHIRTEGSGEVVADVQLAIAKPNSFYEVTLIQLPRPASEGCSAGAPGTAAGSITTDPTGAGAITLRSPIAPGATGAWISIERPQPFSQVPDEFYTSDRVADI